MSAVIPWTNPGGTPCCCDSCPSSLIDFVKPTWSRPAYVRVDLSAGTYAAIKAGASIVATITTAYSGTHPLGGAITSWFPFPDTVTSIFTFNLVNLSGYGQTRCYRNILSAFKVVTLFNETLGSWQVGGRGLNMTAVLQDVGQGITGIDAPLSSPAMYLNGNAGSMINLGNEALHIFDSGGPRIGTAFGQSFNFDYLKTGGTIDTTVTFNMDIAP